MRWKRHGLPWTQKDAIDLTRRSYVDRLPIAAYDFSIYLKLVSSLS